ncbi:MAG: 30S ribosomal protein S2 [Alphaproteobacteria bacterium]|nr:30S ribosomal protein S2 [Alphaproteobacteria bacterium]
MSTQTMAINKETLMDVGAQYAVLKKNLHPSMKQYVGAHATGVMVFDIEKTIPVMQKTLSYVEQLGKQGKKILFIGTKPESSSIVEEFSKSIYMPYVTTRWTGGLLSNFSNIKKRIDDMNTMISDQENNVWKKYTKKEIVLLNRELQNLKKKFWGVRDMQHVPDVVCILDPKKEAIATKDASDLNIPIIAITNADMNIKLFSHPIPVNTTSRTSVTQMLSYIVDAYKKGATHKE